MAINYSGSSAWRWVRENTTGEWTIHVIRNPAIQSFQQCQPVPWSPVISEGINVQLIVNNPNTTPHKISFSFVNKADNTTLQSSSDDENTLLPGDNECNYTIQPNGDKRDSFQCVCTINDDNDFSDSMETEIQISPFDFNYDIRYIDDNNQEVQNAFFGERIKMVVKIIDPIPSIQLEPESFDIWLTTDGYGPIASRTMGVIGETWTKSGDYFICDFMIPIRDRSQMDYEEEIIGGILVDGFSCGLIAPQTILRICEAVEINIKPADKNIHPIDGATLIFKLKNNTSTNKQLTISFDEINNLNQQFAYDLAPEKTLEKTEHIQLVGRPDVLRFSIERQGTSPYPYHKYVSLKFAEYDAKLECVVKPKDFTVNETDNEAIISNFEFKLNMLSDISPDKDEIEFRLNFVCQGTGNFSKKPSNIEKNEDNSWDISFAEFTKPYTGIEELREEFKSNIGNPEVLDKYLELRRKMIEEGKIGGGYYYSVLHDQMADMHRQYAGLKDFKDHDESMEVSPEVICKGNDKYFVIEQNLDYSLETR